MLYTIDIASILIRNESFYKIGQQRIEGSHLTGGRPYLCFLISKKPHKEPKMLLPVVGVSGEWTWNNLEATKTYT